MEGFGDETIGGGGSCNWAAEEERKLGCTWTVTDCDCASEVNTEFGVSLVVTVARNKLLYNVQVAGSYVVSSNERPLEFNDLV